MSAFRMRTVAKNDNAGFCYIAELGVPPVFRLISPYSAVFQHCPWTAGKGGGSRGMGGSCHVTLDALLE